MIPQNAGNVLEAGLNTDTQAGALELMPSILPMARSFCWLQSTEPLTPGRVVQLADITAAPATLVDPANFESGDSTIATLAITPHVLSQPFHMSHVDSNQGGALEWLEQTALAKLGETIWSRISAGLTEDNYGLAYDATAATFDRSELGTLRSAVQSPRRALMLSTRLYNNVCESAPWPAPGFAAVHEVSSWASAGPGIEGLVCDPTALVILSGPPHPFPNDGASKQTRVIVPGLNLSATKTVWLSRGGRELWGSFDTVLGVCVGKASAGRLVKVS